ncbi:MAG: protein phosphatase 2C domain-containing protein [Asticcacaulis sp.]
MKIVSQGTDRGGVFNEDAIGASANAVWVVDGATSLGPSRMAGTSDAAWFAHQVSRSLSHATGDAQARLSAAITEARDIYAALGPLPAEPWAMPSAGVAIVREDGDHLEIASLGDVRVWVVAADGEVVRLPGGEALEAFDTAALERLMAIRAEQGPIPLKAARLQLDPMLRETRAKMNRESGYWVLSLDAGCLAGLQVTRLPLRDVQFVLMATDGFYDLWGIYDVPLEEVLNGLADGQGEAFLEHLRDTERADPEGLRYPRFKAHDDASWMMIQV